MWTKRAKLFGSSARRGQNKRSTFLKRERKEETISDLESPKRRWHVTTSTFYYSCSTRTARWDTSIRKGQVVARSFNARQTSVYIQLAFARPTVKIGMWDLRGTARNKGTRTQQTKFHGTSAFERLWFAACYSHDRRSIGRLSFDLSRDLRQSTSSLDSGQSIRPSQRWLIGMHGPFSQ